MRPRVPPRSESVGFDLFIMPMIPFNAWNPFLTGAATWMARRTRGSRCWDWNGWISWLEGSNRIWPWSNALPPPSLRVKFGQPTLSSGRGHMTIMPRNTHGHEAGVGRFKEGYCSHAISCGRSSQGSRPKGRIIACSNPASPTNASTPPDRLRAHRAYRYTRGGSPQGGAKARALL